MRTLPGILILSWALLLSGGAARGEAARPPATAPAAADDANALPVKVFAQALTKADSAPPAAPKPELWVQVEAKKLTNDDLRALCGWVELSGRDKRLVSATWKAGQSISARLAERKGGGQVLVQLAPGGVTLTARSVSLAGTPGERRVVAVLSYSCGGRGYLAFKVEADADAVAARRAGALKDAADRFLLDLRYHGPRDSGLYSLTLHVGGKVEAGPNSLVVRIDRQQAGRIIDHLAKEGFLAAAGNIAGKELAPPSGPCYTLSLSGPKGLRLYDTLGWGLGMARRLAELRKALDGEAAAKMEALLDRLSGLRQQWEDEAKK